MSEANKELVRRHFEDIRNRKDLAVADELMAEDYLEHTVAPFGQAEPGRVNGPAATRQTAEPTGRRFAARQSRWFRVEGGRLAEHWATREDLVAMLQLGIVQPPGRPPA
jgi:ketosteroid isomerase-like protein